MATGRYEPGDAHRIRIVDGFEEAGVPLDALVGAQEAGLVSVAYYDDLHAPPGHPSGRTYATFKRALGARAAMLPAMYGAFGIAEPESGSHLSVEDEALLSTWRHSSSRLVRSTSRCGSSASSERRPDAHRSRRWRSTAR